MLDDQLKPAVPTPLVRSLGVAGVLFLTLSVATPASSVFVIIPGMLQVAGTGAVWGLILAGIVCVATAFVYAELSSAWPVAGGEYVAVARTLGPLAGFVMLGVNVFNNLLFPPLLGLLISDILSAVLPGLPQIPTAIAFVAAAMLVAVLNIRVNAILTGIFLLIEVLVVLVILALGFGDQVRPMADFLLHPVMPIEAGIAPASIASIGVATSIAIFAFNGYGAAVYFGEEMHEAPRLIARAVLASLVLTLLLVGVPVVAGLAGAHDLGAFLRAPDPFGLLIRTLGSDALGGWVSVGVVVAIFNAMIACILACARFFYSTARDGSWGRPLDRWLVAINPRFQSPSIATLTVGAAGIACCFLPVALLTILSATGLVAIYAGIALAAMVGRRGGATTHAPYQMPLYPLAPVLTLAALAGVIVVSWFDPEEGRPGLIVTALQIAGSILYYKLVVARRGDWNVHVPGDAA